MDYVEGESLAGIQRTLRKRDARVRLDVALKILDDVLSGLHAAHELRDSDGISMGVVHRDVTPHNILVGVDGVARLTDFGVAKAASRLTKTANGLVKGKVAYLAPEQAQGKRIDRTCDIWASGVVAWELFSGMRLHEGLNDAALMLKIIRDPPMRLSHVQPDIPRPLDEVVARALMLDPRARFQTAEEFAEALSKAAASAGLLRAAVRSVRDYVIPLVEPTLAARRTRASNVRTARRRALGMPSLHEEPTHLPDAGPTEVVVPFPTSDSASRSAAAMDPTLSEELGPREDRTSATVFETSERMGYPTATGTTVHSPLRSRIWAFAIVISAVLLVFFWMVARSGESEETPTQPPVVAAPKPPTPTVGAVQPPAQPPAIPLEPVTENTDAQVQVITPSELAVESSSPESKRPVRVWHPAPKPGKPPSAPAQPQPLDNPYTKP